MLFDATENLLHQQLSHKYKYQVQVCYYIVMLLTLHFDTLLLNEDDDDD